MTPIERAALAVKAELRRQEVLWEDDEAPHVLMMQTGQTADLYSVIRAILRAIRDPDVATKLVAWGHPGSDGDGHPMDTAIYQRMIDAILAEHSTGAD